MLVSIILFIISGAMAAGVFLYSQYLTSSNQNKLNQLNSAQAAFDPTLVEQLTRLDTRMNTAQSLLTAHLAPSQLFTALQQSTVQDLEFSSFSYNAANPQQITLTMSGVAGSVNSIALQAQVFSQSGVLANPIFSNIDAQPDGVHFNFTALVNPSAIKYESYIAALNGTAQQTPQPQQQQAPATPASPFESSTTQSQ